MTINQINDQETEELSGERLDSSNTKRKKLVLIDGHAIIHRAFHAVPETLTTSKGENVNATFGFTSMLIKALLEEKPDYIAMTFDRPSPTFRHEQFTEYKAHRPTLPDNIRPQFARIHEVVEAFGIPIYEKDGFEADDVLGTLSVQANQQGVDTIIYTGDMDTLQLVNEHVVVKVAKRGITEITEYDEEGVKARYGFEPEDCRPEHMNRDKVLAIFRELEFRTMVEKVLSLFRQLGIPSAGEDSETSNGYERERAHKEEVREKAEPIPGQEEDLLLAPPVGVVPIMTPPPPPADDAEVILTDAIAKKATYKAGQGEEQVKDEEGEPAISDGPEQLDLF